MRPLLAVVLLLAACAAPPPATVPPAQLPAPAIPAGEDPLRWQADIEGFAAQTVAAEHPVVFVGSSSIRLWSTLAEDMAPLPVLNRGFGGSRIFDTVYWLDQLVTCHDPSLVVVFAGTNDISGDTPRPAAWVAARFDELVDRLRALGCDAPLVYIAISPCPSRERHAAIVHDANARIAARCAEDPSLHFANTASGLLDEQSRPDPRWFVRDRLHLSADGYAQWTSVLRPLVERLLAES